MGGRQPTEQMRNRFSLERLPGGGLGEGMKNTQIPEARAEKSSCERLGEGVHKKLSLKAREAFSERLLPPSPAPT